MLGDVRHLRMAIEEENKRLESDPASPSLARMTENAIAPESGGPRSAGSGGSPKRLHLSVSELAGVLVAMPPVQ